MEQPYITMAFSEHVRFEPITTDAFEINFFKKKYNWINKFCWKILNKNKCISSYLGKQAFYKQVFLDKKLSEDQIIKQAYYQIQALGKKPDYIYLGIEEFKNLASGAEFMRYQQFHFQLNIRDYMGVQIKVIPWMKGILVV